MTEKDINTTNENMAHEIPRKLSISDIQEILSKREMENTAGQLTMIDIENIISRVNPIEAEKEMPTIQIEWERKKIRIIEGKKITHDSAKQTAESEVFKTLVYRFNTLSGTQLDRYEILKNQKHFDKFHTFVTGKIIEKKIIIAPETQSVIKLWYEMLRQQYQLEQEKLKGYCNEIMEKIFPWHDISEPTIQRQLHDFKEVYLTVQKWMYGKYRESDPTEPTFSHPQKTMEIILRELPNPNMNKLLKALLHDMIEEYPDFPIAQLQKRLYNGKNIIDGVKKLTKKEWTHYLSAEEKAEKAKHEKEWLQRRNQDHFGSLPTRSDDDLCVKFADRIHNLRTMETLKLKKVNRKYKETEKYFLHVAEAKNPTAEYLMKIEMKKLDQVIKQRLANWETFD